MSKRNLVSRLRKFQLVCEDAPTHHLCGDRIKEATDRIEELEAIVEKSIDALMGYECWCTKPSTDFPCERCVALAFAKAAGFEIGLTTPDDPISKAATRAAAERAAKEGAGT